ncbi:MAG: sulfotransferase family protein [Cyclobacteriaceae bacterium]
MIINLISGPRNISTALMYAFAQRSDTRVIDEPFYAYYLHKTGAVHPGRKEILQSMSVDYEEVIEDICSKEKDSEILFVKNMAHHLIMNNRQFLTGWHNVFLIRDPGQLLTSFVKVIPNPGLGDIGLKKSWELYQELGQNSIVIDSNEILKSPRKMLTKLCVDIGIPMQSAMLQWEAGARPEDGVWASYWYANVHKSTGFGLPNKKNEALPDHLTQVYEEALKYYNQLYQNSIRNVAGVSS